MKRFALCSLLSACLLASCTSESQARLETAALDGLAGAASGYATGGSTGAKAGAANAFASGLRPAKPQK